MRVGLLTLVYTLVKREKTVKGILFLGMDTSYVVVILTVLLKRERKYNERLL
jgi:hypothetical protein